MMRIFEKKFLFVFVIGFAFLNASKYSGRFDNLDIDQVLSSDRLLRNYFECLMERGPCTPEGSELKRTIPDALKSSCDKCTDSQKQKAAKAISYIENNKPDMYKELQAKYDPDGVYKLRRQKNAQAKGKM